MNGTSPDRQNNILHNRTFSLDGHVLHVWRQQDIHGYAGRGEESPADEVGSVVEEAGLFLEFKCLSNHQLRSAICFQDITFEDLGAEIRDWHEIEHLDVLERRQECEVIQFCNSVSRVQRNTQRHAEWQEESRHTRNAGKEDSLNFVKLLFKHIYDMVRDATVLLEICSCCLAQAIGESRAL